MMFRQARKAARRWTALLVGAAVCGVLLAGCASVSRSTVDTLRLTLRGTPELNPTAEQVQAKPYFQLRATTARGDAILILGNVVDGRQHWYGPDGVAIVLENGRVVQTVGLPENLDGSRIDGDGAPFDSGLQTIAVTTTYDRIDDWSPGYRYGIAVHAQLTPSGDTRIDILGTSHRVLLVTEDISAKSARHRARNRYWVDPADGFVWMSEQEVVPGTSIKLVQLRPFRDSKP